MTQRQQISVLGSWNNWARWKDGKSAESIFNKVKPKYKIKQVKDFVEYDVTMDIQTMLNEVRDSKKLTKNKIVVGMLDDDIIEFLKDRGVVVHTKEIYINSKGLAHLSRTSKRKRGAGLNDEDIIMIPQILSNASAVFLEVQKNKLNLLYCNNKSKKCIKIVVDTKYIKGNDKLTLIKTAGYLNSSDLKNPAFEQISGKWAF